MSFTKVTAAGIGTTGTITYTNVSVAGVITATSATFTGNVSVGGTLTYEDVTNVDSVGLITARSGVSITGGGLVVTGVTTVSAGSTSAPSISPTGDTNTGIFFPSADTIAFGEGGTEVARFDSSGRFSIGSTSPQGALVVSNSGANGFEVSPSAGSGTITELLSYNRSTSAYTTIKLNAAAHVFERTAGESARIDSSGRLLVGTTSTFYSSEFKGYFAGDSNSNNGGIVVGRFQATSGGSPIISLVKSRGASIGTNTIVSNGDEIGRHVFLAADGTNYIQAVEIRADVDGTPGTNDMPGRLVFSTTADGASSPTERMRLDSSGRLGIGGTPSFKFNVYCNQGDGMEIFETSSGNNRRLRITQESGGTTYNATYSAGGSAHIWQIGNGESARIDGNGRFLVGTPSSISNVYVGGSAYQSSLQIAGNAAGYQTGLALLNYHVDGYAPTLSFGTSKNSSIGSNTLATNNTDLGIINFTGNDGTNFRSGAYIIASVDGTSGTADLPTRLAFWTTADGAASPTERMRIAQSGQVVIYGPGGGTFLNLANSGGYSGLHEVNNTAYTIGQNSDVRTMRIGSGANWLTTGVNLAPGGTSWGTYSDERLKTDIVELDSCLESIKNIRCISYRLTNVDEPDSKKRLGVIAQDLVGKYDEAINRSRRSEDDETEYLSVQYTDLVPVLLKALQEATTKIETLEAKVAALESV